MFDRFGEFDSAADINETAINLRKEGDTENIWVLAEENGIDNTQTEEFIKGGLLYLCDELDAALGKLEVEAKKIKTAEIFQDWVGYIQGKCAEDEVFCRQVRRKGKSLKMVMGILLKWSFAHQYDVDKDILEAAGVKTSRCTLGIPGMGTAKKLITEYYMKEV